MSKSIEMESGLVIAQGWETEGHGEWLLNGSKVSLGDGENVLKLIVMAAQFCEDTENHWIIEFKRMNCVVYRLYSNKSVINKR